MICTGRVAGGGLRHKPSSVAEGSAHMPANGWTRIVLVVIALGSGAAGVAQGAKPHAKPEQSGMPAGMDCEKLASMPMAPMSLESCKQMMAAQQAYQAGADDPSAMHPGDEQMTCEQISAELAQQQYQAPDRAKVAEAQAATTAYRGKVADVQAEAAVTAARQQAELDAALAADRATTLATGGVVQGRAASKVQQEQMRQNQARNQELQKEMTPMGRRMVDATGNLSGDMGQQLSANPRLARLMKLATDKKCKGG
jgi:hypothetical protein